MKYNHWLFILLPLIYSFSKSEPVTAIKINEKFQEAKTQIATKDIHVDFREIQIGEIISKETLEEEFQKARNKGLVFPSFNSDKITAAEFNTVFNGLISSVHHYNSAPALTNSSMSIEGDINSELIINNGVVNYENDVLSLEIISHPTKGQVVLENGVYKYIPNLNYYGSDSFSYRVFDGVNFSNTSSVSVTVVGKGIVANNGVRTYFDGSTKKSCYEYMQSTGIHGYSGSIGDGVYKISYNGETADVYCDMTSDGGGWTLVLKTGDMPLNTSVVKTFVTSNRNINKLASTNVYDMTNDYSKLSNSMINAIKHSTASNTMASYRWERDVTRLGDKYFISGACSFQARTGSAMYSANDFCSRRSTHWNSTSFASIDNRVWCNQPNMPHMYFCLGSHISLQVVNNYEYDPSHSWGRTRLWIK